MAASSGRRSSRATSARDTAADLVAVDFAGGSGRPDARRHRHEHRGRRDRRDALPRRVMPGRPGVRGRTACASGCPAPTGRSSRSASRVTAFAFETIGDVDPAGICGSGLVDILAELRRARLDERPRAGSATASTSTSSRPRQGITLLALGCEPARPGQGRQRLRPADPAAPARGDRRPGRPGLPRGRVRQRRERRERDRDRPAGAGPGRPRGPGRQRRAPRSRRRCCCRAAGATRSTRSSAGSSTSSSRPRTTSSSCSSTAAGSCPIAA